MKREGLGIAQATREITAGVVDSLTDVLDAAVVTDSMSKVYNYTSAGIRGLIVSVVAAAVVFVGWPLRPVVRNLDKSLWRRMSSYFQAVWSTLCIGLINPVHLIKTGEFPDSSTTPKVLICNHATDVDWVYLWILAQRTEGDQSGNLKIMMKQSMKDVPLFGQGMDIFDFVFLHRDWEEDKEVMKQSIKNYTSVDAPVWILIFPEGMTINTKSVVKSINWAKTVDDAPELKHTLLPRAKGFEHILNLLDKYGEPPEVFDMTINWEGYSGEIPTWEMGYTRERDTMIPNFPNLLAGTCSERCHMNSEKFSFDDVTSHPRGVEGWLHERWVRKDELMEQFIQQQQFPGEQEDDFDVDSLGKILAAGPIVLAGLTEVLVLLFIVSSVLFS